jgi:hypothetical protein
MKGWGAAIAEAFEYFSPEARRDRVEGGLVSTLDGLVDWVKKEKTLNGCYSQEPTINKTIDHYVRQYDANRKKLR